VCVHFLVNTRSPRVFWARHAPVCSLSAMYSSSPYHHIKQPMDIACRLTSSGPDGRSLLEQVMSESTFSLIHNEAATDFFFDVLTPTVLALEIALQNGTCRTTAHQRTGNHKKKQTNTRTHAHTTIEVSTATVNLNPRSLRLSRAPPPPPRHPHPLCSPFFITSSTLPSPFLPPLRCI
jgi:hypothetical protein